MDRDNFYGKDDDEVDDESYDTNSILSDSPSSAIAEAIKQDDRSKNLDFNSNTNNFVNDAQYDFQVLMNSRKNQINDFRLMIISTGLSIISIGILANLIFNLLVILRKKKRQTCTTLIMFSMCFAYLVYLAFYSLKLSIYFNGDNITKYHIYDTIDNWTYGSFLCKFLSALPITVKLISRLSILIVVSTRIFNNIITRSSYVSSSSSSIDTDYLNEDEVKFKEFFIKNSVKLQSTSKINEHTFESSLNDEDETINHNSANKNSSRVSNSKLVKIRKIFQWPLIFITIAFIWVVCFLSSWPIYSMYKLNRPAGGKNENIDVFTANTICDSVYSFPEDTKTVSGIYLNYLIFALILPCSIIIILLIVLLVLDLNFSKKWIDSKGQSSIKTKDVGVIVTSKGISSASSTASTSFDEANSNSLTSNSSCFNNRTKQNNNILLWLMFIVHLSTSLPQELYRYLQLKVNFDDEKTLDEYLTLILMQPLVKAQPYYAMQLIYTSEFALMPLLFLLFYICSNSSCCSKRRTQSNELNVNIIKKVSFCERLKNIFYDIELSRPLNHPMNSIDKSSSRRLLNVSSNSSNSRKITSYPRHLHHNKKRALPTSKFINPLVNNTNNQQGLNKIQLSSHDDIQASLNEALLAINNHNFNNENNHKDCNNSNYFNNKLNISQKKLSSNSLKPTPFELANQSNIINNSLQPIISPASNNNQPNIVHVIQHPSWRCNIKQQSNNNNNSIIQNESINAIQLPVTYVKNNLV